MVLNPVGFVFVVFVPRKPEKVQGLQEYEPCLSPLIAKTAIRGQKEKHTHVGSRYNSVGPIDKPDTVQ